MYMCLVADEIFVNCVGENSLGVEATLQDVHEAIFKIATVLADEIGRVLSELPHVLHMRLAL